MKRSEVAYHIKGGPKWSLVMHFEDGEFGAIDATLPEAESLLLTQAHNVVGIYRPEQYRYFYKDMKRRDHPAWRSAA